MAFRFFTIPVGDSQNTEADLNGFLASHKVLAVDRRWVDQGPASFWAVCVDYVSSSDSGRNGGAAGRGRGRVDYKESLSPEDFTVFAKLRQLRKDIAQSEAVPVYTVFTNEQLAQMVQKRVTTKAGLEEIAGVGDARAEKYGARVLELLNSQANDKHATDGKPV